MRKPTTIRLRDDVRVALKERAEDEGLSVARLIELMARKYLTGTKSAA